MTETRIAACRSFVVLMLAACGAADDRTAGATSTTRDSSGVQIVTSTRPAWTDAQRWTLGASPLFHVEPESGPVAPGPGVIAMSRLSDGRIAVLNRRAYQIQLFDTTGRALGAIGRKGDGPGEFTMVLGFCRTAGDTLLVENGMGLRYEVFTASGTFVRRLQVPHPSSIDKFATLRLEACLDDGTIVTGSANGGFMSPSPSPDSITWRAASPVAILSRDGRVVASLGDAPFGRLTLRDKAIVPVGFGAGKFFASDGVSYYSGFGEEYSIRRFASDGKLSRIVRVDRPVKPIAPADIAAYKRQRLTAYDAAPPAGSSRETLESDLEKIVFAKNYPVFSGMVAGRDGTLWVREFAVNPIGATADNPPRDQWQVFDADGRWLGLVETPPTFWLYEAGAGYVLGKERDRDGVEYVVMYKLTKPS